MIIDDLKDLEFTVSNDGTNISIEITDPAGPTVVGTFRVKIEKGDAFLRALSHIYREVGGCFSEYDEKINANTFMDNQTSGTITFEE